jgi:hypothetical protein
MTQDKIELSGDEKVAEVLDRYPHLQDKFVEFGFKQITNPVMRRTVARRVTLKMACEMKGIDLSEFIAALKQAAMNAGGKTTGQQGDENNRPRPSG